MISLDYVGALTEQARLADALAKAGFSKETAAGKATLFDRAAAALELGPDARPIAFFVPGRIEVLGKHTDYAGGRTMVVAAERGFALVAQPTDDNSVTVIATDLSADDREVTFALDPELVPPTDGHWSNYPQTVARRIARNFPGPLRGARIAVASDLPMAAGMSSSSAVVVGFFLIFSQINRLDQRPEYCQAIHGPTDLAGYLGTCENGQSYENLVGDRGVGTFGGSEDHTAILCGRPGEISQYSYCPVRFERSIPIPPELTFVVGASGVVAEKTKAAREKYNALSERAAALLDIWRRATGRSNPNLADAIEADPNAGTLLKDFVAMSEREDFDADSLAKRLDHFLEESTRIIPDAGDALATGDWATWGRQVDRSQEIAEVWLENQVDETAFLAQSARKAGAIAASSFGAGFGGSVWAMVERKKAASFLNEWEARYKSAYPEASCRSTFFTTAAGPPAFRVC